MSTYTLPRTGNRALRINAARLGEINTRDNNGGAAGTRWYTLGLYQLIPPQPRYAVSIGYRSQWKGEVPHDEAHLCDTPDEVVEVLRSTIIGLHMIGFPPSAEDKRARVTAILQAHYDRAVSELLECIPPEKIVREPRP